MAAYCQTEQSIKRFMLQDLEGVGPASEWDVEDMEQPYIDLCLTCEVADIADERNQIKIRTLARVFAWRKLVKAMSGDFDFKADNGDYKMSQGYEAARETLKNAERDAAFWLAAVGLSDEWQMIQNIAVF